MKTALAANRGVRVTAAATGINLALGVLYTWSIFKDAIRQSIETGVGGFTWELSTLNDPYALCCLVFALTMILAGKCQDAYGPKITAAAGGILVGAGFILISQSTAYWMWVFGFGILVGMGLAFGYSAATPPALKWFPPNKTGKIAGIVVSGFGLASVYIAPLAQYLLGTWGLQQAMLFFGIAFMFVVSTFASQLENPPSSHVPKGFVDRRCSSKANNEARKMFTEINKSPREILRTPLFWLLWTLYFIGAGAGLMIIGSIAGMAKSSLGANAFLAVAILALGNAGGRIAAGILSDKIGRAKTLAGILFFQALLMFAAVPAISSGNVGAVFLLPLATLIGFNYGANLSLFPALAKDLWGIKNFGVNYGILFTAWGIGGFIMSRASQVLAAHSGGFTRSLIAAGVLLLIGGLLAPFINNKREETRKNISRKLAPETA